MNNAYYNKMKDTSVCGGRVGCKEGEEEMGEGREWGIRGGNIISSLYTYIKGAEVD